MDLDLQSENLDETQFKFHGLARKEYKRNV